MKINLKKIKKVYILGIGGIGVSAIARMMKAEGKEVSGLDAGESEIVEALRKEGISVAVGPNSSDVPVGTELVVHTRALEVADAHILEEVKAKGIPLLSYPQVLKMISEDKYTIAISGMHGKTTTTAMVSHMMKRCGLHPTTIVGSIMKDVGSNFLAGDSDYFIVEADEYRRSFLNLSPKVLVITNIDEDHLDYYKDIDDIKDAFHELAMKVLADGVIICNPDAPYVKDVIEGVQTEVVNYAHNLADIPSLLVPGAYNRENAACAFAVGRHLGLHRKEIEDALMSFAGTWRRFEYIGKSSVGALIYDDYGHHPTEIEAVLSTAREAFGPKKIYVVFHPHLYSRTKLLLHDFARSLAREGMEVLIPPIYPAREAHDPSISSEILATEIQKEGGIAKTFKDFAEIEAYLTSILKESDVLLTLGAGESNKVAYTLAGANQ